MTTNYAVYQPNNDALPSNVNDGFLKRSADGSAWEQVAYGATISDVSSSASAGTADTPARSDHVHAIVLSLLGIDAASVGSLTTTDGTANQVLASIATSSNTSLKVSARVVARRSDVGGTSYGVTLHGLFQNNAGTLTQIGITAAGDTEASALVLASSTFAVSGTSVNVVCTGEAGKTYKWRANMVAAVSA